MDINKVSNVSSYQTPQFIESEYPLFNKFIEYYYQSQEKTGLGQNIVNNFLQYLNIDKLDISILDGASKLVEPISVTDTTITVETVDPFLEKNGSILIGDEVIYYEKTVSSPNIALTPGISYPQVQLKWVLLANNMGDFDGTRTIFPLVSQDNPIGPSSPQHLIVKVYGKTLTPVVDYTISGTNIVYETAPRTALASDDISTTSITYLNGFSENSIVKVDDVSTAFGDNKTTFELTVNNQKYEPVADEFLLAIYDNRLLVPKVDYFTDGSIFVFNTPPLNGRSLSLYSIEAPIPSFGSGAIGYARVNDNGNISSVIPSTNGSGYRFDYPPKVSVNSSVGSSASVKTLVDGIKEVSLLSGGAGYSESNPPTVKVQFPTKEGYTEPTLKATVTNGEVSAIDIVSSGSGYTFTPRITFEQPGGATVAAPTISNGSISGTISITNPGQGYTTPPLVYIDEPTGTDGIKASFTTVLTDGEITAVNILNAGQGYETVPRIAVIDPVGAQVLETIVDGDGRVISVELLFGGSGYTDVPSVYIVDNRQNDVGTYIGGTGATAVAAIFNGQITDINITNFGSGYSADNPPQIVIQKPVDAKASAEVGLQEVTGFSVLKSGTEYTKAQFLGCARAASGITQYTQDGNAVFSNSTVAAEGSVDAPVKCLDALFVKRLLDKYTEQFLPDVPALDYTKIDVRTSIKTIKDFYSAKGTSFSIAYLFKLLYGETVTVSYPKDQIIKPSAATWSVDTVLRATLVSGLPENIQDGLLEQVADISDPNILQATALIENFISIQTAQDTIYELALSEETIQGTFVVPYKTKLAEPLNTTEGIITVDSTIGWPERNGEFVISTGVGSEVVQYKEKSLNQFIECTRSVNGVVEDWDSATQVSSNFNVFINKGTAQEVVLNIVGIVDAQQTTLTDTGSYYLPGDKLLISKLGGTGSGPELTTWLYNVKKLIEVGSITFGGINNQSATVTCNNPHGLLVGDQVTIYGANPIVYNGSFLVTSRDSTTVFQYQLPQPATVVPQGNILVSIDLNKGKSDSSAVNNAISPYTTNIQNTFFNTTNTYIASTGIPNYNIGPFPGSALLPGNQRKLNRFPIVPVTISTKNLIVPGPIGTWVNGVSIWSYKSDVTKIFGSVTSVDITNAGSGYDAAFPPAITISGGEGTGAAATATVNGSISGVTVTEGGSGYTSSPLVSIVGGGGSGASATAIITKGVVSSILVNSGGTGYTSQPSITVVGGGGSGAEGTAAVRGPIQSVTITDGGESYTSNPSIVLSSGTGAVAQAIVNDGRIISIAIISAGSGYTTAPEVTIQGDGFGAVARATIDVDGENAGKVTRIEIINRGIGYSQGTTIINLNSVGQGATFAANVFQWTYNLQETTTVDAAKGSVFEGFNNQYGGEYAHLSNPQRLRYILGDNLFVNVNGQILEQDDQLAHSPIIGWAFDGNPIYGPYGYSDPTNQASSVSRLATSFRLKTNLVYDEITNPTPTRTAGPLLSDEIAGKFVEDYEYTFGLGDLDQYNGRFCKTPEYPNGRYCYFVTIDATEAGNPVFPYILGPSFNSVVDTWNLSTSAVQQNIPVGVVRYRDPYENVDIDVERAPNASTNGLTLENGDLLTFDVEDENRDGVITADEIADPDQIFEESPLQLFDYFPTVKLDSKVDIEVETITKFEDASITGFVVENSGINYQVDDRLIFDNTDTGGDGASARISRIKGESVSGYTFENVSGDNFGVLTTSVPHNLQLGDSVFVDYTPIMDNTNKSFVVRQYKGIEEIVITQSGSGYNEDIPPSLIIDGDGVSGDLEAIVTSVGSIDTVNILNSGSGYSANPRVITSHPQVFKKAEYIVSKIENNENVKVNDVFVNSGKEIFICGKTLDSSGNSVAFVSKLSTTGVKEWEKTLELTSGTEYAEFQKLYVDGDDIWVVGVNRPNILVLDAYNPDIILVKYTQSANGLSASLQFQKGYSGISGSTRADNITCIKKYSDTRYVIGGFTNTNSGSPFDAFIALVDTAGSFAIKRKIASVDDSEKLTDIVVSGDDIYFTLETSNTINDNNVNVAFGKALVGVNAIEIDFIKEYSNAGYSFLDSSLAIDEFNELYINATLRAKSDNVTRDSVWVGKVDVTGDFVWNYRYLAPGRDVNAIGQCAIDIFGDLNIAFNRVDNTTGLKTVDTVKIGYDGVVKNHTTNEFNENRVVGITANAMDVDNSGDVYVFGQTSWNRNEFLLEFTGGATTDTFGNYTPTFVGNDATQSLHLDGGLAKLYGRDIATPANWENAYIEFPNNTLGNSLNENWTLEFMLYQDSASTDTHNQDQQTLVAIGDATDATGGLWLYYDRTSAGPSGKLELVVTNNTTSINSSSGAVQSTLSTMFADDTWQFIGLKKEGNVFTVYVNGISVITATVADTSFTSKKLYIGNIAGRDGTPGSYRKDEQGQYFVDNLKLRNRAIVPTVPSDVSVLPTNGAFALSYSWTDTAWFSAYNDVYDYIDFSGWGVKVDKDADAARIGDQGIQLTTQLGYVRTAVTPVTGSALTIGNTGFALGSLGLQSLDFDDASTVMVEDTETLTYTKDIWSTRTATIPSPGSQKLIISAVVKDRYYFKITDTVKIDNVQILTINQAFRFTVGTKLTLNDSSGAFVNSGYITKVDNENNKVYLAINNNSWTNDLNAGQLSTSQFSEQDTYGIVGPIPLDINQIDSYTFAQVDNTTPGTFTIDLDKYNLDGTFNAAGGQNLDSFAQFKPYSDDDYAVRIDEISGSSTFIVGSVVTINGGDISYNAAYSTATITNLTGVLKITLVANLTKILRVTAVANSDEVYVITGTRHYLTPGSMLNLDGNPSETVGGTVYDEYDGSFPVDTVISPLEFTYKLPQAAITSPATSASDVSIYIKSPVLKMYYGHQYLFDLSHSSMVGGNLSFAKDPLYKLEYSFNSIERVGIPGVTGEGATTPTVKFKVDEDIVTNISYYFDPSRVGDNDSPIIQGSYLDVVGSPYRGTFQVSGIDGATITRGADQIKFPLVNEPEGNADVSRVSYSTSSRRAVGSIDSIRIVNPGGFYTRLPIVSSIQSTRQIERVTINEPGTEYAVGQYTGVPIAGDGEGGFVTITVADGTDSEGGAIPGQVQSVLVTSAGKGYTTASVDIDSIPGILGAGLTGSGAEVTVVIPPFGTAASIFTVGSSVGKIKKLKNNNFGYDYPHDYTLRPEITFPINAQLTSTSILDSVTVTDPGSGYSQAPAVIITGGGGSGAIAQSTIKNGRLDRIEVKDPGLGYSSTPAVELKSSFNYVVNLDLGLLQFSFPHGIAQGSEITLNVVDTGDGADFPIAAGAVGRLNGLTTYYAIAGTANSLEDDQLKFAITPANAALGDALAFTNAGTGRQQVLTTSFGGAATANVITSTFLEGEQVYQGSSFENATAFGFVSTNNGWQVGPRIVKIVDYTGDFNIGESVTGVISKSSGTISSLNIATGVLDVGSITETSGQFIDDVGKPSEIIQKIQDSYYYQDFSYAVKSAISINDWKDILIKNVHPASFKVFGELNLNEYGFVPNKETFFQLTKSVELARQATVPNIQSFALVEPVYTAFDNTEVLFRQKRLTSSENILTSVVQRLDDISNLFDGERIAFPLQIDGSNVVANANQLMIILNGVVQTPDTAFEVQNDSIVFAEPPQPPASVKYVNVTIQPIQVYKFTITNNSGIFPSTNNTVLGTQSGSRLTVTSVVGDDIFGFIAEGNVGIVTALDNATLTGGAGYTDGTYTNVSTTSSGVGTGLTVNITVASGAVTQASINSVGVGYASSEVITITGGTTSATIAVTSVSGFNINELISVGATGFTATLTEITPISNLNLFSFNEQIKNLTGKIAIVEEVNLETGDAVPLADLRYTIGAGTTSIEIIASSALYDTAVPEGVFTIGANYQLGAEIVTVSDVTVGPDSTTLTVQRGQLGTTATSHQEDLPVYGTDINITNELALSKTVGTYQSKPGLFDIQLDDVIIGSQSGVVARITSTSAYQDPVTSEFIEQVNISDGSSFFGLLFNRLTSASYPNVILDNISESQVNIVDFTDNTTDFDAKFPGTEFISNLVIPYDNATGTFQENEVIRNYKLGYGNVTGSFNSAEDMVTKKLAFDGRVGSGFFQLGQVIRTQDTKGEVIGYNQALSTIYLGKVGRTLSTGEDYHQVTFANNAQLDTDQSHYGLTSLLLDGTGDYLSIPTSTEFGFGTGAFTIECWIRPSSVTGTQQIFDFRATATEVSSELLLVGTNLNYRVNGSTTITGTATLEVDTWYHVAISRNAATTKLFVNGTQDGGDFADGGNYGSTKPIIIGASYAFGDGFAGHIDEFRVSNTSRYQTTFTAPTGIFQGDANTKLLLHFEGADTQTYIEDWSGGESFTDNEDFNNDAILKNWNENSANLPAGFAGKSQRYYDAANLIESNKEFVAKEAVYLLTQQYPSLVIPGGNVNCEDDVRDILTALIEDLRNGCNSHIWDASALYVDRTVNPVTISHVDTEVTETVWAYDKVKDILQYIINNTLWSVSGSHGVRQITDTTITDSSTSSFTTIQPSAISYDAATGDMVMTSGGHGLTTANTIAIAAESLTFTCASDGNERELVHPRVSDTRAYNQVLAITAVTTDTFTVNVGASPTEQQYGHTFVSASSNAVTVLDYSTGDCADVYSTIGNLLDILTDTLEQADLGTPVDHLATITKVETNYEFVGATVNAFLEVPFTTTYHSAASDILYTNRIDVSARGRFRDASNLINSNAAVIVDKAAHDMLTRYPDLAVDMPRNAAGGSTDGTLRCKTDLGLILSGMAKDIYDGGNFFTVQAANFYIGENDELRHIRLQVWQSVYAHERLGFYAKQAVTGDLTYDNTDNIIVGDWGITNDAGNCANVQSAIDTLVSTINDIIAPTSEDFNIAGDRLYFNREYIAEEITGLTAAYLTYQVDNSNQVAYTYDTAKCERDIKLLITAIISDLQTGGNNSTVDNMNLYLTANGELNHVEEELLPTVFAFEQIRTLGEKAIRNLLYDSGATVTGNQYSAIFSDNTAYRDTEIPTDIDQAVWRLRDLVDIVTKGLAPSGNSVRNAVKNFYFNLKYYKDEIGAQIDSQFGSGSWIYDSFLEETANNIAADSITTDTSSANTIVAYEISLSNIVGDFTVGETVTSSNGTTAQVLEFDKDNQSMYVGTFSSTAWAVANTLTGGSSTATATIAAPYGSVVFDGTGDYLQTAGIALGTSNFTLEGWIRRVDTNTNFYVSGSTTNDFGFFVGAGSSNIGFYGGSSANFVNLTNTTINVSGGRWYHVAVVREGTGANQTSIYIDGILQGSGTVATNYGSTAILVGSSTTTTEYSAGNISDWRLSSVAVYPKGTTAIGEKLFALPTRPFVAADVTETELLLCQGNTIQDNGPNTVSVTAYGDAAPATISPFGTFPGVSNSFDWYNSVTNVEILAQARAISSPVTGEVSSANLWTNPENLNASNYTSNLVGYYNNATSAPDGTQTAEKLYATGTGVHSLTRDFNLTSFETFDNSTVTFDSGTETFDTGFGGINEQQSFTLSAFFKKAELDSLNFKLSLDNQSKNINFNVNLSTGQVDVGTVFTSPGITLNEYGVTPVGGDWFRVYATITFGFGIDNLQGDFAIYNRSAIAASGNQGFYVWGIKLNSGFLDPYTAGSGKLFYSNTEYNIKTYALDLLTEYMIASISNELVVPSPLAVVGSFYQDPTSAAALPDGNYSNESIARLIRYGTSTIKNQFINDSYYTNLTQYNAVTFGSKNYGVRDIPVGITGGLNASDYFYGLSSDSNAELANLTTNEGLIVKVYRRFRIDGDITDGPFTMNETVAKQGAPSITGVVYGFYEDENFKYLDVEVTAGPWAVTDFIVGGENSTTAQISAIEDRIHIIDLQGDFVEDIQFLGYTSGAVAEPTSFIKTEASVTSNSGGLLTVDTESLVGTFEKNSVVYPASSRKYIDVSQVSGLQVSVGDRIASDGYIRLGVSVISTSNVFIVGNRIYKVVNNLQDNSVYGVITEVDLDNNYIYITMIQGEFQNGDYIGDYGVDIFPQGFATINTKVTVDGAASARVQDVRAAGLSKRIYLTDIAGAFTSKDAIIGSSSYKAVITDVVDLKARVKRASKGFDGTQTNFSLTIENGTPYLPDPEGHMMIFVNGILQPPGATNAYTAFSDQIQFAEAPELGSSFTGFYIGKMRQLDDISFEFDSLRQSFNLKRNEVFYSLTLTEGVQSTVIRPENNIIVSLNGVVQEPGVGFEIVGSRIIFSEIPRVDSTFVAFSYVGSEADVDAAEVVPPIEAGDFIEIEGETEDREVAVIESSNSLITFDYLGSVFGQGAIGQSALTSGFINTVQVTSGGSGYTSRPTVRIDSISGFDGNIRALVGISTVQMNEYGSGYQNPVIVIESEVPDDWTAPNLADYGEELVDPEIA